MHEAIVYLGLSLFVNKLEPIVTLGFDYGQKRVGVAIGNNLTCIARPLITIENRNRNYLFASIKKLVETWSPENFVVGLPLHIDGSEQEITRLARKFGNRICGRFNTPIIFVDERYSSAEASFFLATFSKRIADTIDAEAAKIILQQYLDSTS